MKATASNTGVALLMFSIALLWVTTYAAPLEPEDEQVENALVAHPDNIGDLSGPWDAISAEALRKALIQLDEDRLLARAGRSWPPSESRGWGLRNIDGRLARQWRADKRQVRFRQCYFNPISCFRK